MKREILFKAKTIDGNRWVEGALLWDSYKGKKRCYILEDNAVDFQEFEDVHPETVCQFTGLLDKNGNKIFEGDVFKCDFHKDSELVVVWDFGGMKCKFNREDATFCFAPSKTIIETSVITSNIHD